MMIIQVDDQVDHLDSDLKNDTILMLLRVNLMDQTCSLARQPYQALIVASPSS